MKTYDGGPLSAFSKKGWLYSLKRRAANWIDREREVLSLRTTVGMMSEARKSDAHEYAEMYASLRESSEKRKELWSALNGMVTQFGMDEDEWSKPVFDKAREALDK